MARTISEKRYQYLLKAEGFERRFNALKPLSALQRHPLNERTQEKIDKQPPLETQEDILKQAEQILSHHKPDFVSLSDEEWGVAQPETKQLILSVEHLTMPLEEAYYHAAAYHDWERALLLYQRLVGNPHLSCINRLLYSEEECAERETKFYAQAKVWIGEVEELL